MLHATRLVRLHSPSCMHATQLACSSIPTNRHRGRCRFTDRRNCSQNVRCHRGTSYAASLTFLPHSSSPPASDPFARVARNFTTSPYFVAEYVGTFVLHGLASTFWTTSTSSHVHYRSHNATLYLYHCYLPYSVSIR